MDNTGQSFCTTNKLFYIIPTPRKEVMQVEANKAVHGDSISGDKVGADKVAGNKNVDNRNVYIVYTKKEAPPMQQLLEICVLGGTLFQLLFG